MKPDIIDFLQQSNYIEGEYCSESLDDAVEAWKFLIDKKHLTVGYILKTHGILMKSRELEEKYKGKFRDISVMVGGNVCPPAKEVAGRLERWLNNFNNIDFEIENDSSKETMIKHLHVRFEHIHPFVDGNGRIGRIILNWQRIKSGLPVLIINEGYEQREYYKWFK